MNSNQMHLLVAPQMYDMIDASGTNVGTWAPFGYVDAPANALRVIRVHGNKRWHLDASTYAVKGYDASLGAIGTGMASHSSGLGAPFQPVWFELVPGDMVASSGHYAGHIDTPAQVGAGQKHGSKYWTYGADHLWHESQAPAQQTHHVQTAPTVGTGKHAAGVGDLLRQRVAQTWQSVQPRQVEAPFVQHPGANGGLGPSVPGGYGAQALGSPEYAAGYQAGYVAGLRAARAGM